MIAFGIILKRSRSKHEKVFRRNVHCMCEWVDENGEGEDRLYFPNIVLNMCSQKANFIVPTFPKSDLSY